MEDVDQSNVRRVAIGMGSNLGDSWTILRQACAALHDLPATQLEGLSRVRRTQAIGPGSESEKIPFLNAVALLRTALSPSSLLKELMTVEANFGRVRMHRWMARTLDLDILLDEAGTFCDEDLLIPHPRLGSRLFFLACLEELLPDWRHPWCNLTVRQMVEALSTRPSYFLVVSETFTPENSSETITNQGGESENDTSARTMDAVFRAVNETLKERHDRSQSAGLTDDAQLARRQATGALSLQDIASLLERGCPVVQFASLDWLKKEKQLTQESGFPQPRLMILGPRGRDLLWGSRCQKTTRDTGHTSGESSKVISVSECATPIVFVESDDPANWAMHILAAVDASAELGEVLGDLG